MKTIEIKTTQNVILQYELADLKDRIFAFIIDLLAIGFAMFTVSMFLGAFGASDLYFFINLILIFYSLLFEVFNNGQSLGKKAMGIRVIKTIGGKATFPDYVARWVFRMVDIWFSLGGVASILITSSAKAQRIGDIVANTAVIKLRPGMDIDLKELLSIRSQESYTPKFLAVKSLQEGDVLLIKNALDRHKEYNNAAHREALEMLSQKIKQVLSLEDVKMDNVLFLQTIVNDYVVLTR